MPRTLTSGDLMAPDVVPHAWMICLMAVSAKTASVEDSPAHCRTLWMAAAQTGDRSAYEKLLASSIALVRAAARRQGVEHDQLDDVVQETLITVDRVRHTFDPTRSYDAWLNAIATRRAIDALRSGGRRERRELHDELAVQRHPAAADASTEVEREQGARSLYAAVARLPHRQREAVEQIALRENSLHEAAALTGRGTGALKVSLHRAVKALRAHFHGET